ncbi:MAG: 2Fe-2S iron-sulfur cluster-binding protein [Actinomycetota bacterium]
MLKVTVVDQASGARAQFEACADEPLLDQLQRECTFKIPNLCWMGACGTCALKVACGIEHLEKDAFGVGATVEVENGYVLPCAAGPCEQSTQAQDSYHVLVEV